jgi:DNA-binding transcriptional LysR family regulator
MYRAPPELVDGPPQKRFGAQRACPMRLFRPGAQSVFEYPSSRGAHSMADRRLQVFYTVAKQLSFTKAAEALFMTQPAVTFQVKQLEEQFNARLFDRSHGRIALTHAGRIVFDYAERILKLSSELESRMAESSGEVSGPLLIGASLTNGEFILPQVIGEFQTRFPRVRMHLTVGNSETIVSRIADRTLDLGFIESPAQFPNLDTQTICEDELVVICAPGSELARNRRLLPAQLAGKPYVSREVGSGTREFADRYFRSHNVSADELNIVMELGSTVAIKSVVETGLGFSIVSRATIPKELRLGMLVAIPLEPRLIRILTLVHPAGTFRSRRLNAFVEFAAAKMQLLAGTWGIAAATRQS